MVRVVRAEAAALVCLRRWMTRAAPLLVIVPTACRRPPSPPAPLPAVPHAQDADEEPPEPVVARPTLDLGGAAAVPVDVTPTASETVAPRPAPDELPTLVPAHAGFVPDRASEATCARAQTAAQTKIDALAQGCTTSDDCAVVRSVCPLGCWAVVSKGADSRGARRAVDRYFRDCPVCKAKCTPLPTSLTCTDGVCGPA